MAAAGKKSIALDPFAARNFVEPGSAPDGRAFIEFSKADFELRINQWYDEQLAAGGSPLKDGYAPFCKHLFVPNFVAGLKDGALKITDANQSLLRSEYLARRESELPVLTRWFPKEAVASQVPEATFLDIILYSREQIREENAKMGDTSNDDEDAPWGIVSVKPQSIDSEIPMEPITVMRNALGTEYGGSGVALEAEAYAKSVAFWNAHARSVRLTQKPR